MMYLRITCRIASSFLMPLSISLSTSFLNWINSSAIAVLITVRGAAQVYDEPVARNSKRLPVKANGEVRFRSVLSNKMSGILPMSSLISVFSSGVIFLSLTRSSKESSMADRVEPVNTDMTAGGASCAPKRCEFD